MIPIELMGNIFRVCCGCCCCCVGTMMKLSLVAALVVVCLVGGSIATVTPLTEFVNYDDGTYAWNVSTVVTPGDGYTLYDIYLTSGTWLTNTESNTFMQYHWLQFCRPDKIIDPTLAYLWIDGGSVHPYSSPPTSLDTTVSIPCVDSSTLSFGLYQIPNAPVYFTGDASGQRRTEDAIIAWTWAHFMNNTAEPDWLARMPMTRAGIRAMDAAQEYWDTVRGDLPGIERFVVAGASKRGWTTWTVGCMGDPRIAAIIPVVAPIANLVPQMNEQYQAYGNWTWALHDYTVLHLMGWLNKPRFQTMLNMIDPLTYREEMARIPKYQVGATNDEFFMPDALKWYWDDIPGEKMFRIVPNCEHTMAGHANSILRTLTGYLMSFKQGTEKARPEYSWEISEDLRTITVTATTEGLLHVKVWQSLNKRNRDWRAATCAQAKPECLNPLAEWFPTSATKVSDGVWTHTIDEPKKGHYSAFFIELEYEMYAGVKPITVTSNVAIAPREMPYPPCDPDTVCDCGWDC